MKLNKYRWHYGRKRAVPNSCPGCGRRHVPLKECRADALLAYACDNWHKVLGKSDLGLPTWYGVCGTCRFRHYLHNYSPFFGLTKAEDNHVIPVKLT